MPIWYREYRLYTRNLGVPGAIGQIQNHGGDLIVNLVSASLGDIYTDWPSVPSGFSYRSNSVYYEVQQNPAGSYVAQASNEDISSGGSIRTNYKPYLRFHSTGSVQHITNLTFRIYYNAPGVTAGQLIQDTDFTRIGQPATEGIAISNSNFTTGRVITAADWNNAYFQTVVIG